VAIGRPFSFEGVRPISVPVERGDCGRFSGSRRSGPRPPGRGGGFCPAGEHLRADLAIAAMLPRVTAHGSAAVASSARGTGGGLAAATDAAMAARQRANAAFVPVGADFAGLLMDFSKASRMSSASAAGRPAPASSSCGLPCPA